MAKNIKLRSSFDCPLLILGIVSVENILKLSWAINQSLRISLSQSEKLILNKIKTGNVHEFSFFHFEDDLQQIKYSLIENRSAAVYYFEELRNIDYLFFIRGEINVNIKETVLQNFKKNTDITSVLIIDSKVIKRKEKLELF